MYALTTCNPLRCTIHFNFVYFMWPHSGAPFHDVPARQEALCWLLDARTPPSPVLASAFGCRLPAGSSALFLWFGPSLGRLLCAPLATPPQPRLPSALPSAASVLRLASAVLIASVVLSTRGCGGAPWEIRHSVVCPVSSLASSSGGLFGRCVLSLSIEVVVMSSATQESAGPGEPATWPIQGPSCTLRLAFGAFATANCQKVCFAVDSKFIIGAAGAI